MCVSFCVLWCIMRCQRLCLCFLVFGVRLSCRVSLVSSLLCADGVVAASLVSLTLYAVSLSALVAALSVPHTPLCCYHPLMVLCAFTVQVLPSITLRVASALVDRVDWLSQPDRQVSSTPSIWLRTSPPLSAHSSSRSGRWAATVAARSGAGRAEAFDASLPAAHAAAVVDPLSLSSAPPSTDQPRQAEEDAGEGREGTEAAVEVGGMVDGEVDSATASSSNARSDVGQLSYQCQCCANSQFGQNRVDFEFYRRVDSSRWVGIIGTVRSLHLATRTTRTR